MTDITASTHWVSRDGRVTPIREMADGHLVNTVRMIRRKTDRFATQVALEELGRMAVFAGPEPSDGVLDGLNDLLERWSDRDNLDQIIAERVPVFAALLCELHRRKIKLADG